MLNIGEFAQWTGLTIKALRLYDERGILAPAEVDPFSGYRRYSAGQLRDAIMIKALRDAGVPLAGVADAAAAPDRAAELLDEHRERVAAARRAEDLAAEQARRVLADLEQEVSLEVRSAPSQPYAGVLVEVSDGDAREWDDDEPANRAFGALWQALAATDNRPTGDFWSTIRSGKDPEHVQLVLSWPVAREPEPGFALDGHRVEVGTLPEREEIVASWTFDGTDPAEGAMHPAAIALVEEVERRDLDLNLGLLRQVGVTDQSGAPIGVELAYALPCGTDSDAGRTARVQANRSGLT
ncbi:MerR family transcriptional regulator [Microlunatus parietis]|nr:MerR family transcriptional regulator [Microlunatus parietis]